MQSRLLAAGSWRGVLGAVLLVAAVGYVVAVVDPGVLREAAAGLVGAPWTVGAALLAYAAAFGLRTWAWCRLLPALSARQSWAALHVSLLGNHLLPLRLGEALRVTSVLRRTGLPVEPVLASTLTLRVGDLLALATVGAVTAPALVGATVGGPWAMALGGLLLVAAGVALLWLRRLAGRGEWVRLAGPSVAAAAVLSWLLEAVVVLGVATAAGLPLSYGEAVGVTAATVVVQAVAVTPGGIGSYEAAGTAALVALGAPPADAVAVVLLTHAVKTAYSLVVGAVALFAPAPGYWGRWRLPRQPPGRPVGPAYAVDAPVVALLPARDEQDTVADIVGRLPGEVAGRRIEVVVVDDGSVDATADRAGRAGARVVRLGVRRGLGAAVRHGLAECVALGPACVVYLDADGEYAPEDLPAVAAPVLTGAADYVVGSRFTGTIEVMHRHRRLGNRVLTAWLRWMTRRRDLTDGQSGYRAFSAEAAAAAEVVHDYNYAQVLTLDLLAKGFRYAEVPIRYSFRTGGESFVRLPEYVRRVLPAVHAELNASPVPVRAGAMMDNQPAATAAARTRSGAAR